MDTLVLSHASALRAFRKARTMYRALPWREPSPAEQRRALDACRPNASFIDCHLLERHGAMSETKDELHVLVGKGGARRTVPGLTCHVQRPDRLPVHALLRIDPTLYCCSPTYAALQYSVDRDVPEVLVLLLEMLGTFTLPADATLPISWGGFWPDRRTREDVEQAHYRCDPIVTLGELRSMARWSSRTSGAVFRRAVRLAAQGAASPCEAIMYGMFAAPLSTGGFGIGSFPHGGMRLNHRIDFSERAVRMSSGIPYAICDAYIPAARTDIEYNGADHEKANPRIHDGNRNNGLKAMGIDVLVINREQARDIVALEAIAQTLYKRAGLRLRYRKAGYRTRQGAWLNGLRKGMGLPHA